MRLKFSRLINITLKDRQTVTIPNGELWKYSAYTDSRGKILINDTELSDDHISGWVSEGSKFTGYSYPLQIQGIAFKVVE